MILALKIRNNQSQRRTKTKNKIRSTNAITERLCLLLIRWSENGSTRTEWKHLARKLYSVFILALFCALCVRTVHGLANIWWSLWHSIKKLALRDMPCSLRGSSEPSEDIDDKQFDETDVVSSRSVPCRTFLRKLDFRTKCTLFYQIF